MYFEGTLTGAVIARLALFVYNRCGQPGYGFRQTMVLLFIGIFSFGRIYEMFNISAYHDEQGQAVAGVIGAIAVYGIGRLINESFLGKAMRKVLYWISVGDLQDEAQRGK
jgi:uncharacterized membrane protein YeaQ/YmgE (transglycosylase-associated protein family)